MYRLHFDGPGRGNAVRFLFLDPRARDFFVDWRQWADEAVQYLRASRARYPQDARINELVCELHAACEEFRTAWEAHEVWRFLFPMSLKTRSFDIRNAQF